MQRTLIVVAACMLIVALLFVFDVPGKISMNRVDNEAQPASSIVIAEDDVKKLDEKLPVLLYFGDKNGKTLAIERRYIARSEVTTNVQDVVLRELLKGPVQSTGLSNALPDGTKLLTSVTVKNGVATVNLSKDFADKFPKEKEKQALAIYSIVNTLSETKEVKSVKFTIEGAAKKQLGSYKFDNLFQKSSSMIDKSAMVFSTGLDELTPKTAQSDSAAVETLSPINPSGQTDVQSRANSSAANSGVKSSGTNVNNGKTGSTKADADQTAANTSAAATMNPEDENWEETFSGSEDLDE